MRHSSSGQRRRNRSRRLTDSRSAVLVGSPSPSVIQGVATMQLAMIGLGRMGGNMVRRLAQGGHDLIVYDWSADAVKAHLSKGVKAAKDLADVAKQLAPRRIVWVMVPAGAPTDSTIEQLVPHLAKGDILIDGGNSNF